jgi:peptide subunit release factor 1 (eRF1)
MGISQPTFHRTLTSARKKISKALIDGKMLMIVGEDYITSKKRYKCNICDFEWISPEKEYEKCPDCQSNDIIIILENEESEGKDLSLLQRRSYGGPGIRVGPPRVCKCPECGYESPKTRAVPCRNTKCPKCETPLCGSD